MAVKKKTSKKTSKKISEKISEKRVANRAAKSTKIVSPKSVPLQPVSARSAAKIDELLVKISPALQARVNHLVSMLENTREARLGDLTFLAGRILMRAQEISRGIKSLPKKRKS